MANTKTISVTGIVCKHNIQGMWDRPITFLETQLPDATERRAVQIRNAINTFKTNSRQGRPWPGKSAMQS